MLFLEDTSGWEAVPWGGPTWDLLRDLLLGLWSLEEGGFLPMKPPRARLRAGASPKLRSTAEPLTRCWLCQSLAGAWWMVPKPRPEAQPIASAYAA